MNGLVAVLSAALAAVFITSGSAKACDLEGAARALQGFGVRSMRRPLALALIATELAFGFALLSGGLELYGAMGAGSLALIFAGVIGWSLHRGRRPQCGCLGPLVATHVGAGSLVRSSCLAIAAGLMIWAEHGRSDLGLAAWLAARVGGDRVAGRVVGLSWGAMVALFAVLLVSRQSEARLRGRLGQIESQLGPLGAPGPRGVARGAQVPAFEMPSLAGATHGLADLLARGKPLLLFFLRPGCAPSRALAGDIATWQTEHAGFVSLAVVSEGGRSANAEAFGELGILVLLLQAGREVRDAYGCPGTPGAIWISADGRAASPVTMGSHAIHALWLQAVGQARAAHAGGGIRQGTRS